MRIDTATMEFPVMTPGTPERFVDEWSRRYIDPQEHLYTSNIGLPLTPPRASSLFIWKNGTPLSQAKRSSVEIHYIRRIPELAALHNTTSAEEFLRTFGGGAIWRIFWLHCWRPDRYPIYDQHVHRAMEYILTGRCAEIPRTEPPIIASYVTRYLPFWATLPKLPSRMADKALWTFGKFLKAFPPAGSQHSPSRR